MKKVYLLGISAQQTHALMYFGTKDEKGEVQVQGIECQSEADIVRAGKLVGTPISLDKSLQKEFIGDDKAAFAYTMSVCESIAA